MQIVLLQQIEDLLQIFFVLLDILTKNKNVIQVNKHTLVKEIEKYFVHSPLESSRGVTQAKRHYNKLKTAKFRTKSSFKGVFRTHRKLVVPIPKV